MWSCFSSRREDPELSGTGMGFSYSSGLSLGSSSGRSSYFRGTTGVLTEMNDLSVHFWDELSFAASATDEEVLMFLSSFDSYDTTEMYESLFDACSMHFDWFTRELSEMSLLSVFYRLTGLAGARPQSERDFAGCAVGICRVPMPVMNVSDCMLFCTHPKYSQSPFCAVEFSRYAGDHVNLTARMWHALIGSDASMVLGVSPDGIRVIYKKQIKTEESRVHVKFVLWPANGGYYRPTCSPTDPGLRVIAEITRVSAQPDRRPFVSRRYLCEKEADVTYVVQPNEHGRGPFIVQRVSLESRLY